MSIADRPSTESESSSLSELEMLRRQLERSQQLAAVGELTSTTTHEFNNILMTILNYAKLGMRHKDEPTRDKALSKIFDAANRAAKVTNAVLGLARNRSGELEPTDLAAIVSDTLLLLESELRKYRIVIETDVENVPHALACGNEIQRVLLNLITNARQAIGEGGAIRIRLRHDASTHQIVLSVRDDGPGISQDVLKRIFEPFFSTKKGPDGSGKGGTGLGLATCRDIVERHHGRLRVDSTVGKGTEFHIRLPAA